jgi:signal transduction histidine kinase
MSNPETDHESQDRSTVLTHKRQKVQADKYKRVRLQWWLLPPIGYIATFPLVGLGLLIPFGLRHLEIYEAFLDTPLVLVTLIIALIWGTEPAILSILLGTLAFDIYFLSPIPALMHSWNASLPLVPFVLAEIIMVVLAAQRERNRRYMLFARQDLEGYANELERVNQEVKQANQELEKANKLKDQFLSMASHELKTPITSIRGQAQLGLLRLSKQAELPSALEPVRDSLQRIDQHTHRLNNLVDDLLDLSILSSGKMTLRATRCDIGEMCSEIIEEQRSLSSRAIELELPSSPVVMQADCERLGQIVTNLVTNALKYSPENSAVQVRVCQSNNQAMVQIYNDGSPIPQEQQEHIFEPFYRTPDAQSSPKKGWGLGLAISKQIVERHGGRIRVESSEEKGTTFSLELPFCLDKPSDETTETRQV